VIAALEVPEAERETGESRVDEAEELRRLPEQAEVTARPEAPPVLGVDRLVGHDPRRRHEAPGPEPQQRGGADEDGESRDERRRATHGLRSWPNRPAADVSRVGRA